MQNLNSLNNNERIEVIQATSAHYELARPGTLRLLPPDSSLAELKADYAAMRWMIFGEYPSLSEILDTLKKLEDEINSL